MMTRNCTNKPRTTARDRSIAKAVIAWFEAHARDLPWRRGRTGYTGLVSEAMLQQTQVSRVLDSYGTFMQRFPTVKHLAAANEQQVLASWNGLGYYRRAKNLHAAAKAVVNEHGGEVPRDVERLQALPGVGRYTAGAIASIVYGEAAPLVDGNVHRVLARLECDERPVNDATPQRETWARAEALVHAAAHPGALNEGLMELGALVCTPKSPACTTCPLRRHCHAYRKGMTDQIPPPKRRTARQTVHHHAVVITRGDHILLDQRPARGLWASMWQPPTVESDKALDQRAVTAALPFPLRTLDLAGEFTHVTTHRNVVFHVYRGTTAMRRGAWTAMESLDAYSISNAHRRVLAFAQTY